MRTDRRDSRQDAKSKLVIPRNLRVGPFSRFGELLISRLLDEVLINWMVGEDLNQRRLRRLPSFISLSSENLHGRVLVSHFED